MFCIVTTSNLQGMIKNVEVSINLDEDLKYVNKNIIAECCLQLFKIFCFDNVSYFIYCS